MSARRLLTAIALIALMLSPVVPATAAPTSQGRVVAPMQASGSSWSKDELVLWNSKGSFAFRNVGRTGSLSTSIKSGTFSNGWDQFVPIDLDGDRQDELLRYRRSTGTFRYDDVRPSGSLGSTIRSGTFSTWDVIRAIDFDGDQRDELIFFNKSNRSYRYYDVSPAGKHTLMRSGTYGSAWTDIVPIDLDGDQRDEILFYNSGTGRYSAYNIGATGSLGSRLSSGTWSRWTSVTAIDVDADAADEIAFHSSSSRVMKVHNIGSTGRLGSQMWSGTLSGSYSRIAALNLDTTAHPFVAQILDLVNAERVDRGLRPLTASTAALAESLRWSDVQASAQRMYHRSDLFRGLPSSATYVGENVAMGYRTAAAVMEGWMNSSGHRANILNGRFTHIGIGVAADSDGTLYYTQIFFS